MTAERARPVVAIDGPAGAGKSTVSRRVAVRLGYTLVDTGALYRSVALAAKQADASWDDSEAVGRIAADLAERGAIELRPLSDGGVSVWLDARDVSRAIRAQDVGQGASKVSAVPAVRDALLEMQRAAGRDGGVVLEGRDIGSVVFPDAEVKFFLTASVGVRAGRRFDELRGRGEPADREQIEREVKERDERDSSRAAAPLVQPPDAELVDSSELSIEGVVDRMVRRVREVAEAMQRPAGG